MHRSHSLQQPGARGGSTARSFHFRYLELCRARNYKPLMEVRGKKKDSQVLDFVGDRLNIVDWKLITDSLASDQMLQYLAIRLRNNLGSVASTVDTEKKAKVYKAKPPIYTHYVFSGIIDSITSCISVNKVITVLHLEGLPLSPFYAERIAKAVSMNRSLKELSFQRSRLGDRGVKCICNTIKYMSNLETLNFNDCQITMEGACYIADMLKMQKISLYTEGWEKSLRYQEVDPQRIGGLRLLKISHNPLIGDEGVRPILETLKEDLWLKVLDVENCGLTDTGGNLILDCLEMNRGIVEINTRTNPCISRFIERNISHALGHDEEDNTMHTLEEMPLAKMSAAQLRLKVQQLLTMLHNESALRMKSEAYNLQLTDRLADFEEEFVDMRRRFVEDPKSVIIEYYGEESRSKAQTVDDQVRAWLRQQSEVVQPKPSMVSLLQADESARESIVTVKEASMPVQCNVPMCTQEYNVSVQDSNLSMNQQKIAEKEAKLKRKHAKLLAKESKLLTKEQEPEPAAALTKKQTKALMKQQAKLSMQQQTQMLNAELTKLLEQQQCADQAQQQRKSNKRPHGHPMQNQRDVVRQSHASTGPGAFEETRDVATAQVSEGVDAETDYELQANQAVPRAKLPRLRLVRSEINYEQLAAANNNAPAGRTSKSDHKFISEVDFNTHNMRMEKNIGDSAQINNSVKDEKDMHLDEKDMHLDIESNCSMSDTDCSTLVPHSMASTERTLVPSGRMPASRACSSRASSTTLRGSRASSCSMNNGAKASTTKGSVRVAASETESETTTDNETETESGSETESVVSSDYQQTDGGSAILSVPSGTSVGSVATVINITSAECSPRQLFMGYSDAETANF